MNIKQLTLTVMAAVTLSQTAVAVPADPRPKLVRQADGSYITVVMAGDEHAHITRTADGIPLYYNAATRNFEYARLSADGRFEGSGISAADARQRDSRAKAYIGNLDIARIERAALATTKKDAPAGNASQGAAGAGSGTNKMQRIKLTDFPTIGRQKTLVVLVEFSDLTFTTIDNPHDFYTRMLNEEGFTYDNGATGSARDFYLASSNGLFDPEFVVVGPIKLDKSADYYGADYPGMDYYAHEMIVEACKAIDETVDFAQFDGDGDGFVDNIYCFYAGPGQADSPGATLSIWPHSAELTDRDVELTCDGKRINHYACSNEVRYHPTEKIPAGIGTFVHEFGHVLGLADHYDSGDSRTFTVGEWDTMATGSYNNDGNTPPVFSAFERAELGWLSYTDIAPDEAGVNTLADLKQANAAFRVTVPGNENEYFIFENRQQTGWDAFLPGHGMLVWHIDMDRDAWINNTVNTIANHQRVDIVPADGVRNTGTRKADPFPGTDDIRQFDMKAWDGSTLLALDDVVERAETIRFAFANTDYKQPAPEAVSIAETADSSFVMSWSEVPSAAYYIVNVSTTGADGTQMPVPGFDNVEYSEAQSVTVTGLLPATEYTVSVTAGFGSYRSEPRTAVVTTLELAFEKVIPTGLTVAELYSDGFTAAWDAVDGADGYVVSLCKHSLSADAETSGYDFGEFAEGMPELWSTAGTSFYSISGYYGEAAPSLRMSADGDCLEIAYPDSMINGLSLWCRMRNGKGHICIDRLVDGRWTEAAVITPEAAGGTADAAFEPAGRVRVRFARESGFLLVDDVKASVLGTVRTPVEAYDGLQTGNVQSFTFKSLDHNATYGLRVSATSSGRRSLPSAESVVVTSGNTSGIADIRHDADRNTDLYDLSGRKVSKGNHKKGIYIVPGKGKIVK